MTGKETSENFKVNHSLTPYFDLVNEESSKAILDDFLTAEERYQENEIINRGGMKKIVETIDSLTSRPVAKAVLHEYENEENVERFLKEARLTAALEHPNIVPVYDIGFDEEEGPYFIMKLVGGRNLADILKDLSSEDKKLNYSTQELMEIFLKICDAVAYAHSRGIIHLDLKPENIQIGDYGEVLVCDWGLAKILDEPDDIPADAVDLNPVVYNELTMDGFIKGTPGYMAPEQIDSALGAKNQRTDIYALGGILYSLLCYKVPYESDTLDGVLMETLQGVLISPSKRAVHNGAIPSSLEAVALRALDVEPEGRYQTVSELRLEIQKWMGGFATDAEHAGFFTSFWLLLNRHKVVSGLLLILLVSAVAGIYKIKQNEVLAIANEEKALQNEQKAIANEQKAKDALALYIKEKELTGKMGELTVEQLISITYTHLNNFNFNLAMTEINKSVEFQPDSELLNRLKGEVHFYRQEYKEAILAFEKAGPTINKPAFNLMSKLSPQYAKIKDNNSYIEAVDFVSLLNSFKDDVHERIFQFEAKKFKWGNYRNLIKDPKNLPLIKNHMEMCRMMMHDQQKLSLKFIYALDKDGISLDLSQSNRIALTEYIRELPLKSLNVENTAFWYQWIFTHYFLKSINIRNTNIQKMSFNTLHKAFGMYKIKEIMLTQEQYDKSDVRGLHNKIRFILK